jgi:hypothetical protein
LQDNGTVRRQGTQGWTQVALGDGGDCGTNMAHPDVCYHSYWGMSLERSSRRGERGSWRPVTPPDSGRDQFRQLFYPPLEVNARVVVKAGEVVCVSSDSGATWTKVALPPVALPDGRSGASIASALAIPTTDRVLVGTIWGDVFRIDRHPDDPEWTASPTKLTRPRDGWISDLLVDPDLPQRYWATFSRLGSAAEPVPEGAVLRSDDHGVTWNDVTANLPRIPVNAIVNDPPIPTGSGWPVTLGCSNPVTREEPGRCLELVSQTSSPPTCCFMSRTGCFGLVPAAGASGKPRSPERSRAQAPPRLFLVAP